MPERLTIVCGAYGSGKTEFALTYALKLKTDSGSAQVAVVDLDIVNPYFRSRDIATTLNEKGMSVVSTEPGLEYSDIPALSPRIFSLLQDRQYQVVFDVGGDPAGARALGRFNQYFVNEKYELFIVVNPYRPDTRSLGAVTDLIRGIQNTSRLEATALVSNINLGRETTLQDWEKGLVLISEISETLHLPLRYHAVEETFLKQNTEFFRCYDVFPIQLQMLAPWLL